jgi:hypothetical protein
VAGPAGDHTYVAQARTELGDGDGLAERLGAVERAHRLRLRGRARSPIEDDSRFH